jgi:hypothetical protein
MIWAATQAEYFRANLKIAIKGGGLLNFNPNYTQRYVLRAISWLRSLGLPPRLIILKSRQVGISTLFTGLLFKNCHELPTHSGLVIAHNEKLTKTLLRICRRYLALMKGAKQAKFENVREVHFKHNDSRIQLEVAGEVRGYTAQDVLLSEFAFFGDPEQTRTAVMQTVPNVVDSLVAIESTANGVGNKFYEMWMQSVSDWQPGSTVPLRERGFYPIFIPWHKHREYGIKPWFDESSYSAREHELARQYDLKPRQIAWRRWCIKTNCNNSEETFAQEYPSNPREAFRLTGRPIIDPDALEWLEDITPKPEQLPKHAELEYSEEEKRHVLIYVPKGRFREYESRKDRHTYIVGADLSEGDKRSDYSPLMVLDQMTLNHVATWTGRYPPDQLAHVADDVGRYYFGSQAPAQIINEANNQGINFHTELIQRLHYPNVYFRKTTETSVAGRITMKPGFLTGASTRHYLFNVLRRWVHTKYREHREEPIFQTRCPILINEIAGLVYIKPAGNQDAPASIQAQPGRYKDHAVAFALTLVAHQGGERLELEPLPEEEIQRHASEILLIGERDPAAANLRSLDVLNMTCDELNEALDKMAADEQRRQMFGTGAMR